MQGECKKQVYLFFCRAAAIFMQKVRKWRWYLTDVGCFEMQNAASANQSWSSTNHIGRFGGLDVISQRSLVLYPKLTS